ncbi:hypothetical protein [Dokdonia sp. Asnod3-C12]|uniref:hypothetical protein n=1 Tax=Dokdonia sp. Asnod3-C12 TaxID=3160575 RepID=UPI00386894B6
MKRNLKLTYLSIILLFCSLTVYSQEDTVAPLENLFSANLNIIGAGVTYERVLGNKFTTHFNASYQLVGVSGGSNQDVDLTFAGNLSVGGRYYYNRERRFEKGKKLTQNAGNFWAAEFQVIPDFTVATEERFARYLTTYLLGAKYGLRRNITRNLNYECEFGLGYLFTGEDATVYPLLEFKLQYVLF